jgi:Resolvase, N terminal domain
MLIGYARVSTVDRNLALQRDALTEAGCAKVFTEQMSGAVTDRPALHDAREFARSGDTLIVSSDHRFAADSAGSGRAGLRKAAAERHWWASSTVAYCLAKSRHAAYQEALSLVLASSGARRWPQSLPNRGVTVGMALCLQMFFSSCRLTSFAIGCRRSAETGPTRLNPVPLLAQVKPWMSPELCSDIRVFLSIAIGRTSMARR